MTTPKAPFFILLFSILFVTLISIDTFKLPKPVPMDASAEIFSAERAIRHIEQFTGAPRPTGSSAHVKTREYLIRTLQQMGLKPEVQRATSLLRFPNAPVFSAGSIKNVIVRIPGKNSSGAIALDAHYDAGSTGPGAADCGSGVGVLLESIRALVAAPPLENDLIFVFADAEEVGDLGAHAFATQHPWMEEVRLAINYEAMGTSGPTYLYATSSNNNRLIEEYIKAAPPSLANSFIVGIFNLIPEQRLACDLQDYMDEGSPGLGFVFTGNISAYHTKLDAVDALHPGTVQELGESTLKLLEHFGNVDFRELNLQSKGDSVFFGIAPSWTIHYPADWSLLMAISVLCLLLISLGWNRQKRKFRYSRIVISTLYFLGTSFLATLFTGLLWYGIKVINTDLNAFIIGNWAVDWFFGGLVCFAIFLQISAIRLLVSKVSFYEQYTGALLGFAIFALLLGWVYPVGSFLFLWPAIFGLPALITTKPTINTSWSWIPMICAFLFIFSGLLLFVPLLAGANPWIGLLIRLDVMMGLPILAIGTFFAATLAGAVVPLLGSLGDSSIINKGKSVKPAQWSFLSLAMILLLIGWTKSGFDVDHPHPESIRYELDASKEKAQWVTGDHRIGAWTSRFIQEEDNTYSESAQSLLPFWPVTFAAQAPVMNVQPPNLTVIEDETQAHGRLLTLRLQSPRGASLLSVAVVAKASLIDAKVNDQPFFLGDYDQANEGVLQFNYVSCPPEGIVLKLLFAEKSPLTITLVDMHPSLPKPLSPAISERPKSTMPSPLGADCTVVKKQIEL